MLVHYYQSTDYSCAAACMRMVLGDLGIKMSEKRLMKLMRSSALGGTNNNQLPGTAEFFRLSYVMQRNAKITDIKKLQKEKYHAIVCYIDPVDKIGHFAVVKKLDANHIYFLDPTHGPNHKLPLKVFKQNWKSMFEPDVGLLIGIRK